MSIKNENLEWIHPIDKLGSRFNTNEQKEKTPKEFQTFEDAMKYFSLYVHPDVVAIIRADKLDLFDLWVEVNDIIIIDDINK